jgi:hypothetical protein
MALRRWHCFRCGAGGDAVAFYAEAVGLRASEAIVAMASALGIRPSHYEGSDNFSDYIAAILADHALDEGGYPSAGWLEDGRRELDLALTHWLDGGEELGRGGARVYGPVVRAAIQCHLDTVWSWLAHHNPDHVYVRRPVELVRGFWSEPLPSHEYLEIMTRDCRSCGRYGPEDFVMYGHNPYDIISRFSWAQLVDLKGTPAEEYLRDRPVLQRVLLRELKQVRGRLWRCTAGQPLSANSSWIKRTIPVMFRCLPNTMSGTIDTTNTTADMAMRPRSLTRHAGRLVFGLPSMTDTLVDFMLSRVRNDVATPMDAGGVVLWSRAMTAGARPKWIGPHNSVFYNRSTFVPRPVVDSRVKSAKSRQRMYCPVIVEGVADAISLGVYASELSSRRASGLPNYAALWPVPALGSHLSRRQAMVLRRANVYRAVVAMDPDSAGASGAEATCDALRSVGIVPTVLRLRSDPDQCPETVYRAAVSIFVD